jgi:hypothetical protein
MINIEPHLEKFRSIIKQTLSQMDEVVAEKFLDILKEKLNEQKCPQKDLRSSR